MSRKTSDLEKKVFIENVISKLVELHNKEQIELLEGQTDLVKKYKKAQVINRNYMLKVPCRKTDRFGESKGKQVKKELVKVELEETNEEFIKANLDAENSVNVASKTSDFEAAIAPIDETISVDIVLIKEAISRGVKVFYSSFFNDDKDIKKVGYKNNVVDVYYIKNVGLIEVDNNR